MKKLFSLFLLVGLCFSLVGCSSEPDVDTKEWCDKNGYKWVESKWVDTEQHYKDGEWIKGGYYSEGYCDTNDCDIYTGEGCEEDEEKIECRANKLMGYGYMTSDTRMTIKLTNYNECTWNIKSSSQVMVIFTDGSDANVSLRTNVSIEPNDSYTFVECILGSQHKNKEIRDIRFID